MELRRQVGNGETRWDLIDMTMADNRAACKQGLLERIDHAILLPAPDGTPAEQDFIDGALTECAVSPIVYAMIVAYNRDAFPGNRPTRIQDLFDLERFPGTRSLQKVPEANLEWAAQIIWGATRRSISVVEHQAGTMACFREARRHTGPCPLVDIREHADGSACER